MPFDDVNIEVRIGNRIRELRKAAGLIQKDLAEKAGLSKATLSKIELGQISSPISTFSRIAKCLNVNFEDFLRADDYLNCIVMRRDGPRPLSSRKAPYGYRFEIISDRLFNKNFIPYFITYDYDPRSKGCPNFVHEMDEFTYVLEGELDYYFESECYHLKPGDSIFVDGSHPHGGRAHGPDICRALLFAVKR